MHSANLPTLSLGLVDAAVRAALDEDLGLAGDITTQSTIAPDAQAVAVFSSRDDGIVCGLDFARAAFAQQLAGLDFQTRVADGDRVKKGDEIARVTGNARAILSAERVALNFMCHLSGISTYTRRFADEIAHTKARICDTRKTLPGLRGFEKYAVKCGGGANHRFGLFDAVLIKDNHVAVAGSVTKAIEAARAYVGHLVAIEVEVDRLEQLQEALAAGAEAVMLDNFDVEGLKKGVALAAGRCKLEASGRVDLQSVKAIAETGVDYISTSKITMQAPVLDIGLDVVIG
jgi:nicotinate-nucleotide pyrophosphorylase (carboxylating)